MTKFLKNDTIWRGLAIALLSIIIGIGGWGLLEVTATPKTYATKTEVRNDKVELSKQICDLRTYIDLRFNELRDTTENERTILRERVINNQNKLEKKIDHLGDLIIKHMSDKEKR